MVMKLGKLLLGVDIKDTNIDNFDYEVDSIVTDSRLVHGKCMFVCLLGDKSDGHEYAGSAVSAGADIIVSQHRLELPSETKYIITENTRRADAILESNFRGSPAKDLKIIAVTGTNGKTTVTHMIKSILDGCGYKTGMIGTVANYIGNERSESNMTTPGSAELYSLMSDMRQAGVQYLIMEASSHALAYEKLAAVKPEIGIFTNLTPEHLDFHHTMDNYAAAKAKLFQISKRALINIDDARGEYMLSRCAGNVYSFSASGRIADYYASDIIYHGARGSEYDLCEKEAKTHLICQIPGYFNLEDSLASCAAARLLGISQEDIQKALSTFPGVPGRMEKVPLDADFTVFIDYAHTPDALEKALSAVKPADGAKLTLLFGCGGDRDKSKRSVMGRIASESADKVIITSDNSRTEDPMKIIEDIMCGVDRSCDYIVIPDRREAIKYAITQAQPGEIILIAGKGHENYEINASGKHSFSEKAVIMEAFTERQKKGQKI